MLPSLSLLSLVIPAALVSAGSDKDAGSANFTVTDEVYFDIKVDGGKKGENWKGRFVVGIFGEVLPITAFNFIHLAKGYQHKNEKWHYKNCMVHMVVPDFVVQMGDVVYKDGRGGRSVYAPFFIDEEFVHSHSATGLVGMANSGVDMNHSQFYITLTKARWLDNKNVIIGKVVSGMDIVSKLGELEIDAFNRPKLQVKIMDSGVLPLKEPYDLKEEEFNSDKDVRKRITPPSDDKDDKSSKDDKKSKEKKDSKEKKEKKKN